jgi:hypothetical protein
VEPRSPFGSESQPGQVPLYRTNGFTRLSRMILAENSDGSMSADMKGREGNLLFRTQI